MNPAGPLAPGSPVFETGGGGGGVSLSPSEDFTILPVIAPSTAARATAATPHKALQPPQGQSFRRCKGLRRIGRWDL